ncbi:hypothetical protein UlMin_008176 [Ulmus minor]
MTTAKNANMTFEEIVPSAGWTTDKNGHYLLVVVPGFKKEHLKIQLINTEHIRISGKRLANENKQILFEKHYNLPENSNPDKITAKFEDQILYVTVPKQVVDEEKSETIAKNENISDEKPKDDDNKHGGDQSSQSKKKEEYGGDQSSQSKKKEECCHGNAHLSFPEECLRKMEGEASNYLKKITEILRKNKGSIATAILGFSIGVLFSRKFDREETL